MSGFNFKNSMIALTVVLLAVVEVLDITIVAVALRNMQGALSVGPTQITWTVTIYVISAAIFMPLTGFLSLRFGRKRLLILSALLFGLSSLLCGLSGSLHEILIFRGMQGIAGALLPTLAQAILLDTFEGESSNKAMALFGAGLMVAPILGPILGGWITDHIGWRWIFFINVPVCIIGAIAAWTFLTETTIERVKTDWVGLGLLALGVGSLQFMLDKGSDEGWFSSHTIVLAAVIAILGIATFIIRGIGKSNNVVRLQIFKDRNYTLSCVAMLLYCGILLGVYAWLPLWMEIFMKYPPTLAGFMMAPRGAACLVVMALSPVLMKWMDARMWVVVACLLFGWSQIMMSHFDLLQGTSALLIPNIISGAATGFFFVPITILAYQSMPSRLLNDASGLFNFFRSMGSSIGVALFTTIMAEQAQTNWHHLSQWINPFNANFQTWLRTQHDSMHNPMVYQHLAQTLTMQSHMIAFNDANFAFGIAAFILIPIVCFIHPARTARTGMSVG